MQQTSPTTNHKSIIEKARIYQNNLENKWFLKKIDKEQRYCEFLSNPTRPLPSLRSLVKWRSRFAYASICSVAMQYILIYFLNVRIYSKAFDMVIIFGFLISFSLLVFAGAFDWSIYRRFGNEKSFIDWH